jgi:flagellar biosynthesis/type III secretory pathway chaperone
MWGMEREETSSVVKDKLPDRKEMLLGKLLALMEKQTQVYESLSTALGDEKDRIINIDLNGLTETGQRKEILFLKIQRLEQDRINLMKDLSEILKISCPDLTFGKLMAYSRGYTKDRLKKSRGALLNLSGKIRRMNHFNKLLINHSLELVTGSYSFLSYLATPDTVYHSSGGLQLRPQSGKFISDSI